MVLNELDFVDFFKNNVDKEDFEISLFNAIAFRCAGSRDNAKGRFVAHQCKTEIYKLMMLLKDKDITSYLEIGVENGGNIMVIDSFLRAVSKSFDGSTGVDLRKTQLLDERLSKYCKKYDDFKFVESDCFKFTPEKQYDYIFIDNNLRYNNMKKCFLQYLPFAKRFIGFHDINTGRYGARKLWAELETEYTTEKFVHSGAGIGIVHINPKETFKN